MRNGSPVEAIFDENGIGPDRWDIEMLASEFVQELQKESEAYVDSMLKRCGSLSEDDVEYATDELYYNEWQDQANEIKERLKGLS